MRRRVVAIDGAKMAADASGQANRTAKPIAGEAARLAAQIEAMLAEQAAQTSQDSLPGPGGGSGRRLGPGGGDQLRQPSHQLVARIPGTLG